MYEQSSSMHRGVAIIIGARIGGRKVLAIFKEGGRASSPVIRLIVVALHLAINQSVKYLPHFPAINTPQ
jgi:hypothetical protein